MSTRHIADAEDAFFVINIEPDFCEVGDTVIPFDISRELTPERSNYTKTVNARGKKVLTVDSVVRGVIGDAGSGVKSGTSQQRGDVVILTGSPTVKAEGKQVARHGDLCLMNGGGA
jgi:uncharacterized Zn-binding protein involved in type VI secretion